MNIYLYKNDQQSGPYSEEQIKEMIAQGSLNNSDLAWKEGLENWQQVDSVLGIKATQLPPPIKKPIYDEKSDAFTGTMPTMLNLARTTVEKIGWEIVNEDSKEGLIVFETGISWGSWNGISGTIKINKVNNSYKVSGKGKQIVRGLQIAAFDLFGEANKKVEKVLVEMKKIARM